jgi:hypothetical protein
MHKRLNGISCFYAFLSFTLSFELCSFSGLAADCHLVLGHPVVFFNWPFGAELPWG